LRAGFAATGAGLVVAGTGAGAGVWRAVAPDWAARDATRGRHRRGGERRGEGAEICAMAYPSTTPTARPPNAAAASRRRGSRGATTIWVSLTAARAWSAVTVCVPAAKAASRVLSA
jgi:hypothetical protein